MTIEIKDEGKFYQIKNVNWATVKDAQLVINYVDDNNEMHEEFGHVPEYFRVMDCE